MSTQLLTYREALGKAIDLALEQDDRVFIMGEDVGKYGGSFAVTKGLLEKYGPERVRDTPLSESVFVGAGIGAALGGMRPIVEIMTVNFSLLALDQIVNNAATLCHMSGGQFHVPVVIRMTTGAGKQLAAQHSHSWENWYAHVPGITVLTPSNPSDAYGMMRKAMESKDPVIIFEHALLYGAKGEVQDNLDGFEMTGAKVLREGQSVTIVSYGGSIPKCLKACNDLAEMGIDAELIDLRSLRPFDSKTVAKSLEKTNRLLVVDESWKSCGFASEVVTKLMEDESFYHFDAPPMRVCSEEVHIPYAKHLENAAIPNVEKIITAAKKVVGHE